MAGYQVRYPTGQALPPHSKTHPVCVQPSSRRQSFWTAPAERSDDGAFGGRNSTLPQKCAKGAKENLCPSCASLRPLQFGGAFVCFASSRFIPKRCRRWRSATALQGASDLRAAFAKVAVILDCAGTAQRRRRFRNPRVSRATKRRRRHKRNALCLFAAIAVWWCFRVLRGSFQTREEPAAPAS